MRKFLWIILLTWCVFQGCAKDDITVFEVAMPHEGLSFKAITGGAIMYYHLPEGKDVMSIRVRYQDALGQKMIRTGSYACDSLVLPGFNEARQGVPAKVTLCDRNNVESIPLEVTFDTKDSGPVAFFETVEVKPNWNGFMIMYDAPAQANGIAHVLYTGENPLTGEPDTLLINSFPITEGADTLLYVLKQEKLVNNIVIRTEDFRGYMVKQQVWEGVEAYTSVKYDPSKLVFEGLGDLSNERLDYSLGYKYLFDGDLKGETCFNAPSTEIKTYFAGPGAVGTPLFILDLQQEKMIASVRVYAMLYFERNWPDYSMTPYGRLFAYGRHFGVFYPSCITVEASNDKKTWKKIGTYREAQAFSKSSWAYFTEEAPLRTEEALLAAEPKYISVDIPASSDTYRYLRLIVDELFDLHPFTPYADHYNPSQYVMMQELEVYVNKE